METTLEGFRHVFTHDTTAVFVDARSPEEFKAGTVSGAVNAPRGLHTDKGTRVIVFGRNASQARTVAEEIARTAYWNSDYFGGTFDELKRAGLWYEGPRRTPPTSLREAGARRRGRSPRGGPGVSRPASETVMARSGRPSSIGRSAIWTWARGSDTVSASRFLPWRARTNNWGEKMRRMAMAGIVAWWVTATCGRGWALAGEVGWKAPAAEQAARNPVPRKAAMRAGKKAFDLNCVPCHGPAGRGDGPAAAAVNPKPKNLTARDVQEQSDGELFWKIATGRGPMPSWQQLPEKERWSLIHYIRSLARAKPQ